MSGELDFCLLGVIGKAHVARSVYEEWKPRVIGCLTYGDDGGLLISQSLLAAGIPRAAGLAST